MDVAIYEVKLRLVLCGHLHMSSYTIYRYEYGTLYVRIDSSQKHRVCSVLYTGGGKLEILERSRGPRGARFIENQTRRPRGGSAAEWHPR